MLNYMCGFLDTFEKVTYISLALAFVVVIVVLMCRYEAVAWFVGCLCTFVLIVGAVFSGVKLNKYYKSKGGIIGEIKSVFQPNQVDIEDNKTDTITFDFNSIMLTQADGENTVYEAVFVTTNYIALDEITHYGVYVNGMPCDVLDYEEDYVLADYHYLFQDDELVEIMQDTLSFRFVFYNNQTKLIVRTNGGEDAVKLWNAYFANNSFFVSVEKNDQAYYYTENLVSLYFYEDETLVDIVKLPRGTSYILPTETTIENHYLTGWKDKNDTVYTGSFTALTNTKLYSVTEEYVYVKFDLNIPEIDANSNYFTSYNSKQNVSVVLPETEPTRQGFDFVGWSLDGETSADLSGYVITEDTTIYAIWAQQSYLVTFDTNDGTLTIDSNEYTGEFFKNFDYDTKIVIDDVTKDGYTFFKYVVEMKTASLTKTLEITEKNFNRSLYEIYEDLFRDNINDPVEPEYGGETTENSNDYTLEEITIQVEYITTETNIDTWTLEDWKVYLGYDADYASEDIVEDIYYESYGLASSEDMTIYEKMHEYVESFISSNNLTADPMPEDITADEFVFYIGKLNYQNNNK